MQILADSRLLTGGSIFDKKFLRLVVDHDRIPPDMVHVFHERVAAFTAWEQEVLLEGRHPVLGFHGELMSRSRSGKRMPVNACVFGWQGLGVRMAREGVLLCPALPLPCLPACLPACLRLLAEGDFKARMEAFGFHYYYKTKHMCDACDAQLTTARADPTLSFKNFADDAPWRATCYSDRDLVDQQPSGMWQIRGFSHVQAFRDELHLLPNGISQLLVADVLLYWESSGMLTVWAQHRGLDHHHPLGALWDDFREWGRKQRYMVHHGCRSVLTRLGSFCCLRII